MFRLLLDGKKIFDAILSRMEKLYNIIGGQNMLSDPIVQEILMDITNDEKSSVSIIECILKGKTFDEEIAEETELRLNIVRKVLYKL